MKRILLIIVFFNAQACSWFESDYGKLMNPIKKIKLEEKKLGKPNPVFDEVVEADFPDEKENDKSLEGVDSNQDGVRDDIEIWINRNAEDGHVRSALKEMYRKEIAFFKALQKDESEKEIHFRLSEYSALLGCVSIVSEPFDEIHLREHRQNSGLYYGEVMIDYLFSNTNLRKEQVNKWNRYKFEGLIGGEASVECPKYSFRNRYFEMVEKHKIKRK